MECNRTVCKALGAVWLNKSTHKYYCVDCARRINYYNPGLCVKLPEVR